MGVEFTETGIYYGPNMHMVDRIFWSGKFQEEPEDAVNGNSWKEKNIEELSIYAAKLIVSVEKYTVYSFTHSFLYLSVYLSVY